MTEDDIVSSLDQTRFSSEEPLFENGGISTSTQANQKEEKVPTKKPPKVVFAFIGIFSLMLILLIGLMMFINSSKKAPIVVQPSPSPSVIQVQQSDQIDQLFDELNSDIKNADPLENILPFPPVDADIRITPRQR